MQVYQVCGSLWLMNVLGMELFAGVPQLETDTPVPLFILGAGLVSCLSSIPMAHTRTWILNGVFPSVMQLWYAWYVSGAYPACLAHADPLLAAASFAILVLSYVEAEQNIARGSRARELERKPAERALRASGRITMRQGDHTTGDAISRYGSLANLVFNSPQLYATLSGNGWVERLGAAYPGGPALLFHAYFALGTSTSITLLATTLYTRRLIDGNYLGAIQFLSLAPAVTIAADIAAMGSTTTGNPMDLYLRFLN